MPVQTRIQIRRDTAANWSSTNPILDSGEFGYATDTEVLKVGDGATAWNSLPIEAQAGVNKAISPLNDSGAYLSGSGLVLSGLASNYASSPDSAALSITGDIDIKVKVALTDWTPASSQFLIGKTVTANVSYSLGVTSGGALRFYWNNGVTELTTDSTVATGVTDGATKWVRATMDVDNGSSQRVTKFYTSDDGTTWTQLGTTVTTAGATSIVDSTAALEIGSRNLGASGPANGTFCRVIIQSAYDTADNTTSLVFDANFETATADALALNATSNAGIKTDGLVLAGRSGEYASSPDSAALSITGDIDIKVKVALTDWTPATNQVLVGKTNVASQRSYELAVATDGTIYLRWSSDGGAGGEIVVGSTVATGFADGATRWVRGTLDANDGAGNRIVKFYTSTDGATWTQLGTTITTAGTTSIFDSTSPLEVGRRGNDTQYVVGTIYEVIIQSAYDTANNTTSRVFDADFDAQTPETTSFTESSSNAATVSIIGTNPTVTINTTRYLLGIPSQQPIGVTTLAVSANTDYFVPFFVSCPIAIDMQSFEVTTGPASTATLRSVIYRSDNNFQPSGAPVVDFGTVSIATSATGVFRTQITPTILQPGYYLSAINASVGITVRRVQGGSTDISPSISASPITVLRSASRTHAAFPSSSAGWNTKTLSSNPVYYFVFYRWKLV